MRTQILLNVGSSHDTIRVEEQYDRPVRASMDGNRVELVAGENVLHAEGVVSDGYTLNLSGLVGVSSATSYGDFAYVTAANDATLSVFHRQGVALELRQQLRDGFNADALAGRRACSSAPMAGRCMSAPPMRMRSRCFVATP